MRRSSKVIRDVRATTKVVTMVPPNWFTLAFVILFFNRWCIVTAVIFPFVFGVFMLINRFFFILIKAVKVFYHIFIHLAGIAEICQQMRVYVFQCFAITTVSIIGVCIVVVIANVCSITVIIVHIKTFSWPTICIFVIPLTATVNIKIFSKT